MFRDGSGLEQFNQMLSNPKVVELAKKNETINPKNKEDSANRSSDTEIFDV
jgi:hypothetical protein